MGVSSGVCLSCCGFLGGALSLSARAVGDVGPESGFGAIPDAPDAAALLLPTIVDSSNGAAIVFSLTPLVPLSLLSRAVSFSHNNCRRSTASGWRGVCFLLFLSFVQR